MKKEYKYSIELMEPKSFLVFLNGILLSPGKDFIIKTKGAIENIQLIFRENLRKGFEICVWSDGYDDYWFQVVEKNGKLILEEQNVDKPGFSDRKTKWIEGTL